MRETVVLVHGLWMVGLEMVLLQRRLQACGFEVRRFRYHSLMDPPRRSARKLDRFVHEIDSDVIHFVAHSLGGIVVLHLFDLRPLRKPGRVVMLGTPVRPSATAGFYYRFPLTRPLLGRSVRRGLLGGVPQWKGTRPLAMIAGSRGIGLGSTLLGRLDKPNDGTVALSETRAPWIDRHLTVPCSHFSLVFSRPVAEVVCEYLRSGEFE